MKSGEPDLPKLNYSNVIGNKFIIISFDIPEKDKRKMVWLRRALLNFDFKMFQKSVWIGKTKISEDFIQDLVDLKISDQIKILEVGKTGNLENILSSFTNLNDDYHLN